MNNTIINALNWRYATKKYDTTKTVSPQDLETLIESLHLSPSSFGFQPWKFFVISNPELKQNLAAQSQPSVGQASHIIVCAAKKTLTPMDIDNWMREISEQRGVSIESLAGYAEMSKGYSQSKTQDEIFSWNARQVYIALGFLLETSALLGIDATPMEGFNPEKFDELLGISDSDYTSVVICPIGYRAQDDAYANVKKVRYPKDSIITVIE
jgi:nitroreductase